MAVEWGLKGDGGDGAKMNLDSDLDGDLDSRLEKRNVQKFFFRGMREYD
jgi:hypothetical protein